MNAATRMYYTTYVEFFGEEFAAYVFSDAQRSARRAQYKFKLCRFVASRETFRSMECRKPVRAKYNGRAVFNVA